MSTHSHIFLDEHHPATWRALNGLGLKAKEAMIEAGLDAKLIELLNVRISQINGCAYCLDMHVTDAVKRGVPLSAWPSCQPGGTLRCSRTTSVPRWPWPRVSRFFRTARTRDLRDAYAREHLTDQQYSAVSWLAIAMNAFNRVSVTSQHPVRPEKG